MNPRPTKNKRYAPGSSTGKSAQDRLQETIEMLETLMQKTIDQTDESCSYQDLVDTMEKFSRASSRMASLLKAHRALSGGEESVERALNMALSEVLAELGKTP
jgi:hypothetical protein